MGKHNVVRPYKGISLILKKELLTPDMHGGTFLVLKGNKPAAKGQILMIPFM
jgi:hypothetical protein